MYIEPNDRAELASGYADCISDLLITFRNLEDSTGQAGAELMDFCFRLHEALGRHLESFRDEKTG